MKRFLLPCVLAAVLFAASPALVSAHEYDRDDSDHLLRYVGYALHPIGIAAEYMVLRPIHWFVSRPNLDIIFGHEVNEPEDHNYFEWK